MMMSLMNLGAGRRKQRGPYLRIRERQAMEMRMKKMMTMKGICPSITCGTRMRAKATKTRLRNQMNQRKIHRRVHLPLPSGPIDRSHGPVVGPTHPGDTIIPAENEDTLDHAHIHRMIRPDRALPRPAVDDDGGDKVFLVYIIIF